MLGLLQPTDPAWVQAVEGDLDGLLADHAHCELKAAQSALSLVARFGGQHPELVEPLVALAREETEHFHQVAVRLRERGAPMTVPEPDGYVQALRDAAKPEHPGVPRLLDRLLIGALIEARSCERFKLLGERLHSAELRSFYLELMASEARHHRLFANLAERIFGRQTAQGRLRQLADREGAIAHRLPLGPRVHG